MIRIEYAIVAVQVDKMYDFSITESNAIERRCLEIQDFIESCGWDLTSYIRRMMGFDSESPSNWGK